MTAEPVKAVVLRDSGDSLSASLETLARRDLPEAELEIAVLYSSLNYKDALILAGRAGDIAGYPHVPGIDLVGRVEASQVPGFAPGDCVIGTGGSIGERFWGGFAQRCHLPADRLVRLPDGLSPETACSSAPRD